MFCTMFLRFLKILLTNLKYNIEKKPHLVNIQLYEIYKIKLHFENLITTKYQKIFIF